ncbi:helix-turn-helix domain-containing protein [Actinopolyspora halophila]|uniref:helix-turn-helix domain-containing protein n=1 Tax=Actinopolyspora halophila TaxID=1850 RepID=UPI000367C86E|nr:helix-turn-helix domain-containing protein [Actinopolyspora halophila]
MHLGQRLRRWRQHRGLSQRQLAEQAGCHISLIGHTEAGRKIPTAAVTAHLDRVLATDGDLAALLPTRTPNGVPNQLPPVSAQLYGRDHEWERLGALAEHSHVIVTGEAGIGKTSLAVSWASHTAEFPDGILYRDLGGEPDPERVLTGLLDDLGHAPPSGGIPAQSRLLRSALAHKRMLLVLDGVDDAQQVRPLLPNLLRSRAVLTSRSDLDELVLDGHSEQLRLGPLPPEHGMQLLTHGPATAVATDATELDSLARRAGGHPRTLRALAHGLPGIATPDRGGLAA